MHIQFTNVNEAFSYFSQALRFVNEMRGTVARFGGLPVRKTVSRNGKVWMIDEPMLITYGRPEERVLFNPGRDANPFLHLYESLWMLAGRNDVSSLEYYVKRMSEFSDDGRTFNGAYGYRWRHATDHSRTSDVGDHTTIDQLDLLVEHLENEPSSRRAVLSMWNVEDDLLKVQSSKDVCCNLNVMFSLRRHDESRQPQRLDITVTNRSNDIVWGMLGANYVHFTFLQEYMAARLGADVGYYHHFTNNLHLYEWNWKPEDYLHKSSYLANHYEDFSVTKIDKILQDIFWGEDISPVPLVKDIRYFTHELPLIVDYFGGDHLEQPTPYEKLTEPFLRDVAYPMLTAHTHYQRWRRSNEGKDVILDALNNVEATDWKLAAAQWLLKRGCLEL